MTLVNQQLAEPDFLKFFFTCVEAFRHCRNDFFVELLEHLLKASIEFEFKAEYAPADYRVYLQVKERRTFNGFPNHTIEVDNLTQSSVEVLFELRNKRLGDISNSLHLVL